MTIAANIIATANQQCERQVVAAWASHTFFTRVEFDRETNRWFAATSYKSGIMVPVTPGREFNH